MTLGRRPRGPAARDDRLARPGGALRDRETSGSDFEELPAQRVLDAGRSRLGLGGIVAVLAMAVLLAAGVGVLGGRPGASPIATSAAAPASRPAARSAATAVIVIATPRVTPAVPCAAPGASLDLLLEVDNLLSSGTEAPPERIEVPVDASTRIVVQGERCAVAWEIRADQEILELERNPDEAPEVAAQNRFEVRLGDWAGTEVELTASLDFGPFERVGRWPLRIIPISAPDLHLGGAGTDIVARPGCDTALLLRNDGFAPVQPCVADPFIELGDPARVRIGERYRLTFAGDWFVDTSTITCWLAANGGVFGQVTPCTAPGDAGDGIQLLLAGPMLVSMEVCGSANDLGLGSNRICGTWWTPLDVR